MSTMNVKTLKININYKEFFFIVKFFNYIMNIDIIYHQLCSTKWQN